MSIKNDILALVAMQEQIFHDTGNYAQVLPTPEEIPLAGTEAGVTMLNRPPAEGAMQIPFVPTATDYQFEVNVWFIGNGVTDYPPANQGFMVIARRQLGDDMIEEVQMGQSEI